MKSILCAILTLALAANLKADETHRLDETIAAGVVFKISYVMGSQGSWADLRGGKPADFEVAMRSIARDLENLSDSRRGNELRDAGEELISLLIRAVVSTADAENEDGPLVMKELGLVPGKSGPEDLARAMFRKLGVYGAMAGVPAWVSAPRAGEMRR